MNWKKIDVEEHRKEAGIESKTAEKLNLRVEDEEGNDLVKDEQEVVVDDSDTKEQEVVVAKDDDEDSTKDSKDSDDGEADKTKKESKSKDDIDAQQRKSRAKERIQELIKKNKELEAKWQSENESLRRQLLETSKESVDSQKVHLEERIKEVKKSLAQAQVEGKFEEATEYMANLNDLQTQKTVVDSYAQKFEKEVKEKASTSTKERTTQGEPSPKQALAWMVRNKDWWKKDEVKTTLAAQIGKEMENEGLDPSSREYFDELDERIAEFIGENDDMSTDDSTKDAEINKSSDEAKTKKPPQTTSGASRTSTSKSSKNVIKLTTREREIAKKLGMTELDFAKQKVRSQNKDEHGYQIVFDK